jgi:protein SCO1/2
MKRRYPLLITASLALGLVAGVLFWKQSGPVLPPPELSAPLLSEPRAITPFQLTAQDGSVLDAARLQGKWSLMFIGYTHCPDVCPTTLQTLVGTARRMEASPDGLDHTQFVFVSVDPKRDSPAQLRDYLAYFHPAFIGATGEREQIDALVRQLGGVYMFEGDTEGDSYIVNHSATLYLIDPQGRYYARLQPPHEAAQVAETLARIRSYYER